MYPPSRGNQNLPFQGRIFTKNGTSKPYKTSSGVFYTKSAADKKIISNEELRRLFAESKRLYADEEIVVGSDISDLNSE